MKSTLALMLTLLLIVALGVLTLTPNATEGPKNDLLVGASYMNYWGTGISDDWPTGSVYTPILGNYSSDNATIAGQQIENATQHGISFFFLDYGWGDATENTTMENAAINGIINASKTAGNFSFCIFYFPNWRVNDTTIDETGLKEDFAHINKTYFKYSSYLRLNGRYVVILADFPKYLNESLTLAYEGINQNVTYQKIDDMFLELKEKYSLYLIPALWPSWNSPLQIDVLNDSSTRAQPVYDAITLWGDTTIINWSMTISYSEYFNKTKDNFETWNKTAANYSVSFVPLICPGYNNLIYTHMQNLTWWAIVTRNPQVWNDTYQLACLYANSTSNPLHMILIFTWNDFKEGTSIEPTDDYGSTYLDVITPEFPSIILLPLFMVVMLLATIIYRKKGKRSCFTCAF